MSSKIATTGDTLFLVAARSGSKSVPGKNIRRFGKLPALAMRVISTLRSGLAGDIVCSTDSQEYADIARAAGAWVPFLRPTHLANDAASSIDVILHALDWLEVNAGKTYKNLVLMEPSSPFTRPADLKVGLELLQKEGVEFVVSVRKVEPHSTFVCHLGPNGEFGDLGERLVRLKDIRRQAFAPEFTPSGSFYAAKVESLRRTKTFYTAATYAFAVDSFHGLEIDSEFDFLVAQAAWEHGFVDKSLWQ